MSRIRGQVGALIFHHGTVKRVFGISFDGAAKICSAFKVCIIGIYAIIIAAIIAIISFYHDYSGDIY